MKTLYVFLVVLCGFGFAAENARGQQTQAPAATPAASPAPKPAQEPAAAPTTPKLSTQVKVVTLYATARDKKGKIIANLNKEDFVLDEDGRSQTITYFVRETDVPLTMGLLVDTSMSQRRLIDSERDASYTFLDHMLREDKDKAFLIHFDRDVELLQDLTSSRPKLQAGLQQLQTPTLERASDDDNNGEHHHAGTLLYDAIFLASNELMKKQQGRKAIFVLTDGVDRGSKESLEDAVEAAQRADTSIYSIYFADQEEHEHQGGGHGGGWGMGHGGYGGGPGYGGGWPGGGQGGPGGGGGHRYPQEAHVDGKKVLTQLSNETGGRMIEVSKKLPIDQAYAQIEEELRNQYSLAYTPTPADTGAGYHKIHLTTKNTDISVFARDGYYTNQ